MDRETVEDIGVLLGYTLAIGGSTLTVYYFMSKFRNEAIRRIDKINRR